MAHEAWKPDWPTLDNDQSATPIKSSSYDLVHGFEFGQSESPDRSLSANRPANRIGVDDERMGSGLWLSSGSDLGSPHERMKGPRPPEIPGYVILGELGRGAMGVVYRARQIRLNRQVAIKMILAGDHASPDTLVRFLAEAETIAKLRHPNIVQIYAIGDWDGRPYVELEYVEGGSLGSRLEGTPWPPRAAARLLRASPARPPRPTDLESFIAT